MDWGKRATRCVVCDDLHLCLPPSLCTRGHRATLFKSPHTTHEGPLKVSRVFLFLEGPLSLHPERQTGQRKKKGMAEPPVYEVFFTGRDDPRDGCIVIGEDTKPIFYRFETPPSHVGNPRTTVSCLCSFSVDDP